MRGDWDWTVSVVNEGMGDKRAGTYSFIDFDWETRAPLSLGCIRKQAQCTSICSYQEFNAYHSLNWRTAVASSGQRNAFPCWSTNGLLSSAERFRYVQLVLIRIIAALMLEMMLMNARLKINIVLARRIEIRTSTRNITYEVTKTECPVPGLFHRLHWRSWLRYLQLLEQDIPLPTDSGQDDRSKDMCVPITTYCSLLKVARVSNVP